MDKGLVNCMSTEKILSIEVNDLTSLCDHKKSEKVLPLRVDINTLLTRARKVKEKKTRTNLVFSLIALSLIFIFGFILSF